MAAKIGILAENTSTTIDTETTVYTVPADKSARVRILIELEGNNAGIYNVQIGTPGAERTIAVSIGTDKDVWTGSRYEASPNPTESIQSKITGIQEMTAGLANMDGVDAANFFIVPLPFDYFLSTGDTVKFYIATGAVTDHLIQVVGVEDDA